MVENILIIVSVLLVLCIAFFIGIWVGIGDALDMCEADAIYCFECETEMPVKEKKGKFYCTNCGLYHGSKI